MRFRPSERIRSTRLYKSLWLLGACLVASYVIIALIQVGSNPQRFGLAAVPAQAQAQTTIWIRTPSGVEYTDSVDGQVRCYRYGAYTAFQFMPLEKTP